LEHWNRKTNRNIKQKLTYSIMIIS